MSLLLGMLFLQLFLGQHFENTCNAVLFAEQESLCAEFESLAERYSSHVYPGCHTFMTFAFSTINLPSLYFSRSSKASSCNHSTQSWTEHSYQLIKELKGRSSGNSHLMPKDAR